MAAAKEYAVKENAEKEEIPYGVYNEKSYKITLPLTSEKSDDVTVFINGKKYKIQRGVEVEVSADVYEVLMNSSKMDMLALVRSRAIGNVNF